jgi:hypothetical protein
MMGKDGKPFKWTDFARVVDLDDPFFKTINLNIMRTPTSPTCRSSVDVHCEYPASDKRNKDGTPKKPGGAHTAQDFRLQKSDDVGKFASFTDDNDLRYSYRYIVNFKGDAVPYVAKEAVSDSTVLTVDVDSSGCLAIDIGMGNVNFDTIFSAVIVDIRYEDKAKKVALVEQQFTFDKDHRTAKFGAIIHAPRTEACFYDVTYQFKDGRQYVLKDQKSYSRQIYVNSPFTDLRTMHVRPVGDLAGDIANIFVDLKYEDPDKGYVVAQSFALNKGNPFADWNIPVFDRTKGKISYSGTIHFADGTAQDVTQGGQPADLTKDTLMVGRQRDESEFLTITCSRPARLHQAQAREGVAPLHRRHGDRSRQGHRPPGERRAAPALEHPARRQYEARMDLGRRVSPRRRQRPKGARQVDRDDTHSGASGRLTRSYPARGARQARPCLPPFRRRDDALPQPALSRHQRRHAAARSPIR